MIEIEKIDSFSNVKKETWNTLLDSCRQKYIFQTFEFQYTWWKHFGEKSNRRDLLLLLAKENNSIIGIAPLMAEEIIFLRKPVIKFIGTPSCDYMDFIILENREKEVVSCFFNYLKKLKCLEIDLVFVPDGSCVLKTGLAQSRLVDACPYVDLGDPWEVVYNRLNKSIRQYVSRRQRNILKLGKLEFSSVKEEDKIDAFLDEYFRMHIRRWHDYAGRYSQFQYARWRNFIRELSHILFSKGYIDLTYLKLNSDIIACHTGFIYNKIFHWYMATFNPDYSKYSPGHLLTMYLLKNSCCNGLLSFDFLRGTESHKMLWAQKTKHLFNYLGYSDYYLLKKTGRLLRIIKDFYLKNMKERLKKISPSLLRLWYKSKGDAS